MIRDVCFNVSHWVFGFWYFNSAIEMPYIFENESTPYGKEMCLKIVYWVLLVMNVITPIGYNILLYFDNYEIIMYEV